MAPNLSKIQRAELQDIVISKLKGDENITDYDIGKTIISCSQRTVGNARSNILRYGKIDAPRTKTGRPRKISENIWLAVKAKIDETDRMGQGAIARFIKREFGCTVSRFTVSREIERRGWSGRAPQEVAKEADADLQDDYLIRRSKYDPEMMVFVDESGMDRSIAKAKKVYGPKGVRPKRVKRFHRGPRVQVLPAYTMDGVLYYEVYQENTDHEVFEDFIERLLPYCGRYPQPKSVIFMDNASIHFSKKMEKMMADAGVILEYQPPYSPELNPIEHFFGSLKNIIRSKAENEEDLDLIKGDFQSYIEMQIGIMKGDEKAARKMARGHFRLSEIHIVEDD